MRTFGAIFLLCGLLMWRVFSLQGVAPERPQSKQSGAAATGLPSRQYHEGEKLRYFMKGRNEGWNYEIQADGVVKKDSAGRLVEEYAWSNMNSDGKPLSLKPGTETFRQVVSLATETPPSFPDLSHTDLNLVGPLTDWMTIYVDLWLALRLNKLHQAGDHFYFKRGTPNSWADGNHVVLGEDSIDFDFTLKEVNQKGKFATLLVRHVPPEKPEVKIPVEWMRAQVADMPNNWVEVTKMADGKYLAEVGKESFDVLIKVSLEDGRILDATIHNPVETQRRECTDAALTNCGAMSAHQILREIEVREAAK